ncbi:MAG: amidohydrolase [Pseudomonadota bacterium]
MSTLNITIVQADLHWHDAAANRHAFARVIDANSEDSDLIVLPEMFSTGFSMAAPDLAESMDGPTVNWLAEQAARSGAAVCGSLIIEESGRYYNRFLFFGPDGERHTYDKRHLFRLADEHEHYAAGVERKVFSYRGVRICPQVCYDLRFPVWSRFRDDYDLLLYVANWPDRRHHAWATLIRARAIENQCFVAAVNRTGTDGNALPYKGGSAVIDFLGEDLLDVGGQVATGTAEIDLETMRSFRERFAFYKDADRFTLLD